MGDYSSFNCNLPPGFRFYPTDEELVVHFLQRKAALLPYHPDIIPDLDLYPYDPWDLNGKAMGEGNKWYFYSRIAQIRFTGSGYWQSLGLEEPIYASDGQKVIGFKRYCTFYIGQPTDQGLKTNWIMHEYRLSDSNSTTARSSRSRRHSNMDYGKWVVCRVYENDDDNDSTELSCLDEVFLSLDDLDEISLPD